MEHGNIKKEEGVETVKEVTTNEQEHVNTQDRGSTELGEGNKKEEVKRKRKHRKKGYKDNKGATAEGGRQ